MGLLKKAESRTREPSSDKIETDIDRLYALVLEHAPVKLSKAVEILGKKREIIEDWARTLEAANLIKIHYPAISEPELVNV